MGEDESGKGGDARVFRGIVVPKSPMDELVERAERLLPVERWQTPSEREFNQNWFTLEDALGGLFEILEPAHKRRWIMERLIAGEITAVARRGQPDRSSSAFEDLVPIDPALWETMHDEDAQHFWETNGQSAIFYQSGDYIPGTGAMGSSSNQRFFDVRLQPESFDNQRVPRPVFSLLSATSDAGSKLSPAQSQTTVGRPAKHFWEPLLIEMARQLYGGELQPKRQVDIEAAMHEWLSSQGFSAGETQVRECARKLWQQIEK